MPVLLVPIVRRRRYNLVVEGVHGICLDDRRDVGKH